MSSAQLIFALLLSLAILPSSCIRLLFCCSVTEGQLHDTLTLLGGIDLNRNEVIVAYSSGLDKTIAGRLMLEYSGVKLLSFEAKNELTGRVEENSIWDQVASIKRNSLVLKALVTEEGFI